MSNLLVESIEVEVSNLVCRVRSLGRETRAERLSKYAREWRDRNIALVVAAALHSVEATFKDAVLGLGRPPFHDIVSDYLLLKVAPLPMNGEKNLRDCCLFPISKHYREDPRVVFVYIQEKQVS